MVIDTSKLFSGSWKTTLFGLVSFLAGMIVAIPAIGAKWPLLPEIAKYVLGTSVGGGLLFAKDSNVTGGTVPNTSNDSAVVAATAVAPKV